MSAPIGTVYGTAPHAKTQRLLALAKYAGLELKLSDTIPPRGDTKKPEYLAKFPLARIPSFEGADGFLLIESRAIARYIAGMAPNAKDLLGSDAQTSASIDLWVNFADDEIFNHAGTVRRMALGVNLFFKPAEDAAYKSLELALNYLNNHLQTRTFLVGHRITLADIIVGGNLRSLYAMFVGPEIRDKYPNVLRYLHTVIHQPGFGDVYSKDFVLAEKTLKYAPPKKEDKPKAAPAAPAPKKAKEADEGEDEPLVPAEPKTKNPLDDLPKSPFILDEWKRVYSNKDTRKEALPWFWENFDAQGWSLWKFDFKYNEELTQIFMSANQIGGFFNRLEASRKYVFGTAGVFGEANSSLISGVALCRGQDWKPVLGVAPDIDSYNVIPLDHTKAEDKKLWDDFLAWEVSVDGKAWADGKVLK